VRATFDRNRDHQRVEWHRSVFRGNDGDLYHLGGAIHTRPSATGCTIRTREQPETDTILESRLYVPGRVWPILVSRATVAWADSDEFTLNFSTCRTRARYVFGGVFIEEIGF
jgi:hypothetical protein